MTHGQAAQDPEVHRVSECVCLRLAKEFEQSRNRPKDTKGKTMPIPQSIVSVYSHIRQLLEDSRVVLDQTNLVLVPVNNTTVSSWYVLFHLHIPDLTSRKTSTCMLVRKYVITLEREDRLKIMNVCLVGCLGGIKGRTGTCCCKALYFPNSCTWPRSLSLQ